MGLSSVWHWAEALFLSTWANALSRAVGRHNAPSVTTFLDSVPMLNTALSEPAAALHAKGIEEAQSLETLFHDANDRSLARRWRSEVCKRTITRYDCEADVEDVVTRKESGGQGAGAWLLAPRLPRHKLRDQAFVTSVRARLWLPIYTSEGIRLHRTKPRLGHPSSQCACQRDIRARHPFLCQVGGAVVARHNALRDLFAEIATEATGLPSTIEQHDHSTGDARRPDVHFQNERGETVHVDVAVVTFHAGRVNGDPRQARPGWAVATEEAFKRRKYRELRLMPAVVSHLGRPGADLATLIKSLSTQKDLGERSEAISSMWQSWSSTLMHWNAHILATAGPLLPP